MLNGISLLDWFEHHPQGHFWLVGSLILLALGLAVVPLLRDCPEKAKGHDWAWGVMVLAILVAGRWPTFLIPRQFNVDESQLLAGAHALSHDPVFWRAVNGGTAGPLDFFALWPAGWICGGETYLAARLTALVLLASSLILVHQCMALVLGSRVARIAGLGAVCFEALTNASDFLHYSTELLPGALLAAAAYAATRRWASPGGPWWSGLGGLMLGAVPFGKLQAAPLAAVLGLCWLWAEIRAKGPDPVRHRAYLVAGAVIPATLFACQLTIAGEWPSFITSYLLYNLNYAAAGSSAFRDTMLEMLKRSLTGDSLLHWWLPGNLVWLALMLRLRPVADRVTRIFSWTVFAAWLISLASIVSPGRPLLHYWQLLMAPGSLLLGAMTAQLLSTSPPRWRSPERWLVALCVSGVVGAMLIHRAQYPNPFVRGFSYFRQHPRTELAAHVAAHARPGESIAIWGWSNNVYVETGLRQATRDPHIGGLVETGPLREYFRERYLVDLKHSKPALFLDSVGPASLFYVASQFAHDRDYPDLAAVIRANYVLVEEFSEARIYRRRDLVDR